MGREAVEEYVLVLREDETRGALGLEVEEEVTCTFLKGETKSRSKYGKLQSTFEFAM